VPDFNQLYGIAVVSTNDSWAVALQGDQTLIGPTSSQTLLLKPRSKSHNISLYAFRPSPPSSTRHRNSASTCICLLLNGESRRIICYNTIVVIFYSTSANSLILFAIVVRHTGSSGHRLACRCCRWLSHIFWREL
jgi:hypothetical protein